MDNTNAADLQRMAGRCGEGLVEGNGLRINVSEKAWRDWFIKGMTPVEAADRARADYDAMRPPVDRTGRRKR